jgi:HlyD family secretion protein
MKNYHLFLGITITTLLLLNCNNNDKRADGYGNFEATEIIVSAESNGKLMQFNINEGDVVSKDVFVGYVDTIPLHLQREQLKTSKDILRSKSRGVLSQIDVLKSQLNTAAINKQRLDNMFKDNAATQKQLDDINGEINVINQQIKSIETQNSPLVNELKSIDIQITQLDHMIGKCKIINPISGTVLTTYAEPNEVAAFGKPLYKIADLKTMQLRVFVSETQLAKLKIGDEVNIKIDDGDTMKSYSGIVSWIASEAEFTPKIIQTKEERVSLVYAVKIDVENDGSIKIGMPAEMWLKEK